MFNLITNFIIIFLTLKHKLQLLNKSPILENELSQYSNSKTKMFKNWIFFLASKEMMVNFFFPFLRDMVSQLLWLAMDVILTLRFVSTMYITIWNKEQNLYSPKYISRSEREKRINTIFHKRKRLNQKTFFLFYQWIESVIEKRLNITHRTWNVAIECVITRIFFIFKKRCV